MSEVVIRNVFFTLSFSLIAAVQSFWVDILPMDTDTWVKCLPNQPKKI
jgi:hypothetical protein